MARPVGKSKKSDWLAAYINRVRRARENMHPPRTARDVAEHLQRLGFHVDPNTYPRYETRTPLPLEFLLPFCHITGARIEDILDYTRQSVERDRIASVGQPAKTRRRKAKQVTVRPPPLRHTGTE